MTALVVQRSLPRDAAALLESGRLDGRLARALSRPWRAIVRVRRRVALPPGARVIGVGGAVLGGAGKTPLVLALAQALAAHGVRVAVASSAYPVRAARARIVSANDRPADVGDEPLWLARELAASGVPVVSASSRGAGLALAAQLAPLVIADGLLQAAPAPLALSLLVVDAAAPWGAGRLPPAGDLRADVPALLAACDCVVTVGRPARIGGPAIDAAGRPIDAAGRPVDVAESRLTGYVLNEQRRRHISTLLDEPVGLVVAVARPDRIVASLAEQGIVLAELRSFADHAVPRARRASASPVQAWLTTAKCAVKLGPSFLGAPVSVIEHEIVPPAALLARVLAVASGAHVDP